MELKVEDLDKMPEVDLEELIEQSKELLERLIAQNDEVHDFNDIIKPE